MGSEEVKTNPDLEALFIQLAEPFDPSEIKWRVAHTTRDGSRGAVIAFADPRAYTDRAQPTLHPYWLDTWLRGLHGIGSDPHKERQADSDRQGVGDLHADHHWTGLPCGQRRGVGR